MTELEKEVLIHVETIIDSALYLRRDDGGDLIPHYVVLHSTPSEEAIQLIKDIINNHNSEDVKYSEEFITALRYAGVTQNAITVEPADGFFLYIDDK